jgi:Fur family transcriptional regulator, zinc uptake regulator
MTARRVVASRTAPQRRLTSAARAFLERAEALCRGRGLSLTPGRRGVLAALASEHRAVGAYELMELIAADGRAAHPPTVYRALDFLMEAGLVHRISALNAYVACDHPGEAHPSQLLVCRNCGRVAELSSTEVDAMLDRIARRKGFKPESRTVELQGLCAPCGRGTS